MTSLYKASAKGARRLAERFEWYYTPMHDSWLDMTEIQIGILSLQTLTKPSPDVEDLKKRI